MHHPNFCEVYMSFRHLLSVSALVSCCAASASSQQSAISAWEHRVKVTSSKQPAWAVPVVTPSSGLVQLIRFDAARQYTPTHTTIGNIDGGKGFNFIPWYKTEVDVNLPPFVLHNSPSLADGP